MEKIYVYIDEFGNPHLNLEKAGTFSHYVYTAIVFKESDKQSIIQARDYISKKYFKGTTIKSRNITNDEIGISTRKNILNDLKKHNFIIVSLIINKTELSGNGLKYKKVFYKFFQRIFVEKFANNFTSFEICADKVGYPEFQRELKEYINTNGVQRDLFNPDRYYKMAEDTVEEPLIQLADFLCGCIGKIYCISHQQQNAEQLFDILADRIYLDFFPLSYKTYLADTNNLDNKSNLEISKIAIDGILDFVEKHNNNAKYLEHIEILKYLLLIFRSNPNKLVSTKELISVVKKRVKSYSQDNLRQHIAHMRDQNLLITSPQGKYGYKIPNTLIDMVEFYNRYFSSIKPMLRRIQKSNDLISLKTVNGVNILTQIPEFNVLQELIGVVQKNKVGE